MSWLLVTAALLLLLLWWCRHKPAGSPPQPRWRLPFIGHLHLLTSGHIETDVPAMAAGAPLLQWWAGGERTLSLLQYETARDLLMSSDFRSRPTHQSSWKFQYVGVANADGEKFARRKLFLMRGLKCLGLTSGGAEEFCMIEAAELVREIATSRNIPKLLQHSTCNVISLFIFGHRFDYSDRFISHTIDCIDGMMASDLLRDSAAFLPLLGRLIAPRSAVEWHKIALAVQQILPDELAEHRHTRDSSQPRDLLDLYLAEVSDKSEGLRMTQADLEGTITDLIVAGTDTTATVLQYALLLLGRYQDEQEKVFAELSQRAVTYATRADFPYTQAFITEVNRWASPVAQTFFRSPDKDVTFAGYQIKKETSAYVDLYTLAHDERHFNSPRDFSPARWLSESGEFVPNKHFIPFSMGHRACLGQELAKVELFLMFSALVLHHHVSTPPDLTISSAAGFILKPTEFSVSLKPRST